MVAVGDLHDHRAACGYAVLDAAKEDDAIALDMLPAAATVAALPANKIVVDLVFGKRKACGKTFDYNGKGGSV
jgi:hypothetical protein